MANNKSARKINESVDDPRELLLSLVDMGSIDSDEMLLACVAEMSDAECKRVLNTLSLPGCSDSVEEEPVADDMMVEFPDEEPVEDADESDEEAEDEAEFEDEEDDGADEAELEARIRRLENSLRMESRRRFNRR